ncbi:hypothetical protein GCM10007414_24180 [Agarivorans gilvus]|uniref:Phosphodiester glycosidase domain-containing protein n=2 Tax=Agarivorans gilvus TaxID=680279 RepID=A0ABQ1I411_9ALTE|nr:hypothetical protein GCM10007414_24180 [Agarivorans gilvus]
MLTLALLFMNEYLKLLVTLPCLWLSFSSPLAAQVEQFEYDDFIISDCPSNAPTLSISEPHTLALLTQQSQTLINTVNGSLVVAAIPYLSIDEKQQSYRKFSLNQKSVKFSHNNSTPEMFMYGWQNQAFEWFNSYRSNQNPLSPSPFLALARYQNQTLAFASASLTKQQQLPTLLNDNFIQQREPLIVFIRLDSVLSEQSKQHLEAAHLQHKQHGDVLIASRGIAICDSGSLSHNQQQRLVWIKTAPN